MKRPGQGARISREQFEARRRGQEEEDRQRLAEKQQNATNAELARDHYNNVEQRGRQWRQTDSKIKGLRNLNNWIKSTLIQKFSRPEGPPPEHYFVLDMACGKGGDIGKWEKAPIVPALYVGCDIADISINQARGRYDEALRKNRGRHGRQTMQAEFYVQDTFGQPLSNIETIRKVGFNPNAGPASGVIQPGMMSGGFHCVSMMFALHYSFESEDLVRGMLKNVAGALVKRGRFIAVMPNSDVISAQVMKLLRAESGAEPTKEGSEDGEVEPEDDDSDGWDPEKPSEPADDWDPEKPSEPTPAALPENNTAPKAPLEWGNSLYTVRFPRDQPLTQRQLPADGVFRPPYGWKYHYQLEEAVDVPEFVVPWEGFRALAEEYGLELMYRKGFKEVLKEVWDEGDGTFPVDGEGAQREQEDLRALAERMGVLKGGSLEVGDQDMEAAGFYHAFCFYKT